MAIRKISFGYEDVELAVSAQTLKKARDIFESGSVTEVAYYPRFATARVFGTHSYDVALSYKDIMQSDCTCYAGKEGYMCKHTLALALFLLNEVGVEQNDASPRDLSEAKLLVRKGMGKIRAYSGPSRVWFSYQKELEVGAHIISEAVANLPAEKKEAKYVWDLVLRLSKKLSSGGVDDSDGFVGDCIYSLIDTLVRMSKENPKLTAFLKSCTNYTGFGFEERLQDLLRKNEGT